MALIGNVVVRRPGEPEAYAATADLHEQFVPGNPDWGHPPREDEVRATNEGWGEINDPRGLFGPTVVRWYPTVQWFDGQGFADHLRSTSLYRKLDPGVRIAYEFPADRHDRILYSAGLVRPEGKAFYDALKEAWAVDLAKGFGFIELK